jgi:glycosyltransferase involved in cell wall biosynthesis
LTILLFTTRNGMTTLPRMLERLARLRRPPGLRIVAVDNGSSDGTGALLRDWAGRLSMQVFDFPMPGKNRALNAALDRIGPTLADADLVVVTDDDILPREDWLERLLAAARTQPQADLFGGVIEPDWPHPPEGWLLALEGMFPVLFATTGASHGPCTAFDIYGPNMAVRGRVLAAGARFEPGIGPDGSGRFGMGSESEFLRRLERAGHRAFFCGDAVVGHQVEPQQMTPGSVVSRAYRYGFGRAMMDTQARPRFALLPSALHRVSVGELKALAALSPWWRDRLLRVRFQRQVQRGYMHALLRAPALPTAIAASPLRRRTPFARPVPSWRPGAPGATR